MNRIILLFLLLIFIIGCTKEVTESERRLVKSAEENVVQKIIENFYTAYNNGDLETAISLCDNEYKAVIQDEDETIGLEQFENELHELYSQYPDGKWNISIEELIVQNEIAYVMIKSSFLLPDPINEELAPVYSERSIRILRKNKPDGWKIFRSISVQIFSWYIYFFFLDALQLPPIDTLAPSKNPKLYHPPLLFTAYIATLSENREIIKLMGAIKPCHNPWKKPNVLIFSANSTFTVSAQPLINNIMTADISITKLLLCIISLILFIYPPFLLCEINYICHSISYHQSASIFLFNLIIPSNVTLPGGGK